MGRGEGVRPLGAADMARGIGSGLGDVTGLGGPRVICIPRNTNPVTLMKELLKLPCRKHEQDLECLAALSFQTQSYPC